MNGNVNIAFLINKLAPRPLLNSKPTIGTEALTRHLPPGLCDKKGHVD